MSSKIFLDYRLPDDCKIEIQLQNVLGFSEKSDKFSPYYDEIEKYKISSLIIGVLVGGASLLVIVFIVVFVVERYKLNNY
jgi:hypothetical protein